ncbi:glycosyltransferase [Marinobacterium aestuariivivens]|uniref:Glycosyltransferase n=1 Tax=Marinobacterium aestuariivivens TaxID=1698799 RepID=A0ABW1ZVP8_9GAMM
MRLRPLKALFYSCVLIVCLLLGYKAYLNFFLPDFEAEHSTQIERIQQRLQDRQQFSFAVVGNIRNSIGIFEHRIIPRLNASGVDFLVSSGNAVSGGGEDNYRALFGSLGHLEVPYLLTFGEREYEEFGSYRYYEHFGPHFFSFRAGNSRFIFLDSSGKTPWRWQLLWLQDLLQRSDAARRFLFVSHPPLPPPQAKIDGEDLLQPAAFREALLRLIRQHRIDAVFSAQLPLYAERPLDGTRFFTTGGGGGLVLDRDKSFYHYLQVSVSPQGLEVALQPLEGSQPALWRQLESLWLFIYSLIYVGYLNFILITSLLALAAIKLHALVFTDRDYYPDYDLDLTPWSQRPLKVAMFSNNYLPFIGGVPLSIERLRRGLEALGNAVLIVAPGYREQPAPEPGVIRVPTLLTLGVRREFRLANVFLRRIRRDVRAFAPDLIHLHHPFWLGSLGLWLARRLGVPAVFTYHTRLEHYAHFVPLPGILFRNLISHALIRRFANRCNGVIVPTWSAEEYLRLIGVRTPILIQPTGIDVEHLRRYDARAVRRLKTSLGLADERVLISVSRLSNEKNIDFLIDAIDCLHRRTSLPFRLLIIGDGHQRKRLQTRIEALQLDRHIVLLGAVPPDEIALYYRLGDLFAFASKSETQGMVILEAMAAGLPVVAVRASGIDDVVCQGGNGFKTAENIEQWSERVLQLLEDEALRQTMAREAQALAAEHSIERFAARVREFYDTLLATSPKR